MIREWKILERKPLEDHKIFKIHTKVAQSPRTGVPMEVKAISLRDWVIALPLTSEGEVVMVRQYRHGIESVCLELPGGLVDPGDGSARDTAKRELREETGYEAPDFIPLGSCFPSPAVLENRCFFFLAADARSTGEMQPDQGEDLEVVLFPLEEIPSMIETGAISNGMVQLAFYKFFEHLGRAQWSDTLTKMWRP
ncbi:MAG: NUDIX hydrolase [Syntrophobacteraceae bacterium]|nr:NUDIX hydrolase [Syntrophobacteraceae bacterium]